jgi:hypothetical protein
MPLPASAFSTVAYLKRSPRDLAALVERGREPSFDWGFDLDLLYEQLSVFARHLDGAAPITKLPVFWIAVFALTDKSRTAPTAADREAKLVFPRLAWWRFR